MFNVVVVDDSTIDALIIRKTFESIDPNLNINHFDNGEEALRYLNEVQDLESTLVLLDMNMPVLGGLDFLLEKSKNHLLEIVPVFTQSSHYAPGEEEACKKHGVKLLLEKPIIRRQAEKVLQMMDKLPQSI